jgi:hypothetical protein
MAIQLELTDDEALVLFEWLYLLIEGPQLDKAHLAEKQVLWKLEGELERQLVAPLQPDYDVQLKRARDRLAP